MPSTRVASIELAGFRGIRRRTTLQLSGKSLLLFGENGTGKSSFVEGLEYVLTGGISSLDGRGQGISSGRHAVHVLEGTPDAILVLTTNDQLGTIQGGAQLSKAAASFAMAARVPDHYILRRSKVLRFVEAVPKDRYELLRPFLPLQGVSDLENRFSAALQGFQAAADKAQSAVTNARSSVTQLAGLQVPATGDVLPAILTAVQQALVGVNLVPITELGELQSAIGKVDAAIEKAQEDLARLPTAQAAEPDLTALKGLVDSTTSLEPKGFLDASLDERKKAALVVDESSAALQSALAEISSWIEKNAASSCPVCEQPIDPNKVTARIQLKLSTVREYLDAQGARKNRLQELETGVRQARNAVVRALVRPSGVADEWWGPRDEALRSALTTADSILEALKTAIPGDSSSLVDSCSGLRESLRSLSEKATLPPPPDTKQAAAVKQNLSKLVELRGALAHLLHIMPSLPALDSAKSATTRRVSIAASVVAHLQEARKDAVRDIYGELAGDIDDFYGRVHPKEAVGDISIDVKTSGQGSATLRGRFHEGNPEDPRGYFSEAHLDTLGICVFLALRKRLRGSNPDFDLLVLDDVLTSVDAPHASRVADLLLTEFKDYQLVLTTHNVVWYEHLRGLIAGKGLDQYFVARRIHQWNLEEGPDVREITEERDDLAAALKDGTLGGIAGGAGRLLEQMLSEMRYELAVAVPAKRDERYTLADLWAPFKKKIRNDFKGLNSACASAVTEIDRLWFTRNWAGAHYNEWAKELSIQDAKELASAVLDLFSALRCSKCQRFVSRSGTPVGQVACRCGRLLHFQPSQS